EGPGATELREGRVDDAEVETFEPGGAPGDPPGGRAGSALPAIAVPGRRRPRLLPPEPRDAARRIGPTEALQAGHEAGWPPARPCPRPASHVRYPDGRAGGTDADAPGVDGAPGLQDDADLRGLRAGGG